MVVFFFLVYAILAFVGVLAGTGTDVSVVNTKLGPVQGIRLTSGEDVVDAYYGIPYAEPPTGNLRFLRPFPVRPWKQPLNATRKRRGCVQTDIPISVDVKADMSLNSEDCLYINIWVPRSICGNIDEICVPPLPVFVYIHGGFFTWGTAASFDYDGFEFARRARVIFVSFNYRLGVFGFLNASLPEAAGNMGLYDQVEALRWIRGNIAFFGGDKEKITLAGQSAGAISASYHMMSNFTKGMFKRAVLLSGTPPTLGFLDSVDRIDILRRVGQTVGCYDYSKQVESQSEDIVKCLRTVEAHKMAMKLEEELRYRYTSFIPGYGDEFMPTNPLDYTDKDIHVKEVFLGDTANDGAYMVAHTLSRLPWAMSDVDSRTLFRTLLRILFDISYYDSARYVDQYLPPAEESDFETTRRALSETVSDVGFECPADIFSNAVLERSGRVYRYIFDHRPSFSFWEEWVDVTHGDDVVFFLGTIHATEDAINASGGSHIANMYKPNNNSVTPGFEYEFCDDLVEALGEFSKTGKPKIPRTNKDWPKYTKENKAYLVLKPNDYRVAKGPRSTKCHLWEPYLVKRKPTATTPSPKARPSPKHGLEKRPKLRVQPLENNIAAASAASVQQSVPSFMMAAAAAAIAFRRL